MNIYIFLRRIDKIRIIFIGHRDNSFYEGLLSDNHPEIGRFFNTKTYRYILKEGSGWMKAAKQAHSGNGWY